MRYMISMTRQTLPDICDLCAKEITSESQYVFEPYQGKKTFADEITKGKLIDCCHKCFIGITKNGYKPQWETKTKNPNYVAGSKVAEEKYWLIKEEGGKND